MTSQFPKACASGDGPKTYQSWMKLPLVGEQDDGRGGKLELRNCTCKSTLAVRKNGRP
jgi:hypothetical protein